MRPLTRAAGVLAAGLMAAALLTGTAEEAGATVGQASTSSTSSAASTHASPQNGSNSRGVVLTEIAEHCLNAKGAALYSVITLANCTGSRYQIWAIHVVGNSVQIRLTYTNGCLGNRNNRTVILNCYNGSTWLRTWRVHGVVRVIGSGSRRLTDVGAGRQGQWWKSGAAPRQWLVLAGYI